MSRVIAILIGMLFSVSVYAAIDTFQFDSAQQEQQYRHLTESLRCPKCQNNSIADSNSMIAADMRQKVWQLMKQGQSNQQITQYMVARYGNFVTYEPPLMLSTLILWAGPALFVLLGALTLVLRSRRSGIAADQPLDDEERQRLDALLNDKGKS
ncbi:Cytochrome c heme lyase subunit CcmL [Paramixta manurensis]|uniref:Cytochrome c-type biogenesis protein n=1 Tax=Paramixta manurensis TaxID=2740817 RepID=A0A6M8UB86_9GAMM|nr:Cytochrome c heme lyase subunit CcmL [Erwiniaceae bacterium PD-1]